MLRRPPLHLLFFGAVALVAGCRGPVANEAATPTHLLIVTLDTLRADRLGAYGYRRPVSPQFDRFAAGAHLFEDATCSMPTTLPSHVSIFTGLRPLQHGVRLNGVVPERDLLSIFDLLAAQRDASTAAVVSAGVLEPRYLAGLGLQEIELPTRPRRYQVPARTTTSTALAWLREHAATGEAPFALWVHYYDTHEPYAPPSTFRRRFAGGYDGPLPDRLTVEQLVAINRGETTLDEDDLRYVNDLYDAEVAYLDHHLGRLFAGIDELGLEDSTVVVVVGDHGQAIGEQGFFGHGLRLLEPVVKVPLVLRLAGAPAGRRIAPPVETIDLMPTLIELFALELPAEVDLPGRSLMPLVDGRPAPRRDPRWIERRAFPEDPGRVGVALHAGDWKAVFYRDADGSELRHLGVDRHDLDGANRWQATDDRARLLEAAAVAATVPVDGVEPDDEQRRMLEALGYLD